MTWIGVHNAIISTANHAKGFKFNLSFLADTQLDVGNNTNQVQKNIETG